jgi:cysteine desulfurase
LDVKHIITSKIEHHAVGHTVEAICEGGKVTLSYVKLSASGQIDLAHLEALLQSSKEPTLVSLMHANNEIATLISLEEIGLLCRNYGAYFHSDTVQTMGHYRFDLSQLPVDFITCAAHKFHGPKGVGFLYVNNRIKPSVVIHGGSQERGLRGGTENVYGIVGLAKAMDLAYEHLEEHQIHVQGLKNYLMDQLTSSFKGVYFHGEIASASSLYTVLNVCFPRTDKSDMLLFTLDLKGVAVSGGSACTSGASKGSHVLEGIGADMTRPNVRFSFSRYTTKEEIDFALEQVVTVYNTTLV